MSRIFIIGLQEEDEHAQQQRQTVQCSGFAGNLNGQYICSQGESVNKRILLEI